MNIINMMRVGIDNAQLRELAALARQNGTEYAFMEMALQWADAATAELIRMRALLNAPEVQDFMAAVPREAAHQRERWGSEHDAGKEPEDWFWLLGWLAGKAVHAAKSGDIEKAKHHAISSAAVLANWHAALSGVSTDMRPGIDPVARGLESAT